MCSAALWHATVSLHFFLPTNLPTRSLPTKSLETNTSPSPGAPGSFSTHSFCRSVVPQCTPSTTRLETAQIDDDTPHSQHSLCPLLLSQISRKVCEMNRVDSGWPCRLSTQPFSIDPRANTPRTGPNRQRSAHSHSLCPLLLSQISRVESHTSRGLSRIQHQFTVQIWPFKHTYVASRDTIAPTTSNGQKVRPIFVPMAPNKTRKRMRRRMHNQVSFVAIAGIWNGFLAQRRNFESHMLQLAGR